MNVCFKNIPRIFPGYWKVMKTSAKVKKFKILLCGLSCESFNIASLLFYNVFLSFAETVLHLD